MKRARALVFAAILLASGPAALAQSWTRIASRGAGPRFGEAADAPYDSGDRAMITFGGKISDNTVGNQTWLFDLGTHAWRQVATPGTLPAARKDSATCYDPALHRLLIF